jgi:hypothetical protein
MLFCSVLSRVKSGQQVKQMFNISISRHDFMSPKSWVFQFLETATKLEATIFTVGDIWEARNDARKNRNTLQNPKV